MSKFSTETVRKVYDDQNGDVLVEIGPDPDSLGLVEILNRDEQGNRLNSIVLPPEAAKQLAEAIRLLVRELELEDEIDSEEDPWSGL